MSTPTSEIIVVKIGGSTLGGHDTTLADVAELHRRGEAVVIVHGGGPLISDWLKRLDVPTKFERGLRVTDAVSLDVVVAVLAGLVNKQIVASLSALGVPAVGLSGVDGGILKADIRDEALGFVGEITEVDAAPIARVLLVGSVPVIAPIAIQGAEQGPSSQLLNINADTAAGAMAALLRPSRLVFMTDVQGVKDGDDLITSLAVDRAKGLIASGVIEGGMIPKVEACLGAVADGCRANIIDGRAEHALLSLIGGSSAGTEVGPQ
jgi:acetylglutamate kinase